jgi:hypothetical protein
MFAYFFLCLSAGFWKTATMLNNQTTLWILNIFLIFEIFLLMLFFQTEARNKKSQRIFMALAFLLGVVSVLLYRSDKVSEAAWINAVAIIAGACYLFYETLEYSDVQHLSRTPSYWFITALLIYFTGSFFVFLHNRYVFVRKSEVSLYIEGFRCFLLIGKSLMCSIGVWYIAPSPKLRLWLLLGWGLSVLFAAMLIVKLFF